LATGQLIRGRFGLSGMPVLLYHGLTRSFAPNCPLRERKYWISSGRFREHLALIRRESGQVVRLGEFWNSSDLYKPQNLRVALTFDDGNCSDYEIAFPLLLEAGYPAVFFINTGTVGTRGFLNWQQIAEMQRAGMSFQSHSHDHLYLSRLPIREIERQLKLSNTILADRLGVEVKFLAVPYGDLSPDILQVAMTTGYRAVCTSRSWPARPGMNLMNRVVVYSLTGQRAYERILARSRLSYSIRAGKEAALFLTKRVLFRFLGAYPGAAVLEDPS